MNLVYIDPIAMEVEVVGEKKIYRATFLGIQGPKAETPQDAISAWMLMSDPKLLAERVGMAPVIEDGDRACRCGCPLTVLDTTTCPYCEKVLT